jgi:DNA-binding transcriptional LysR family regulator
LTDDLCRSAGFVPRVVCKAEEADVITGLVRSGVGVALLPESLVDGDGALIPLRLDSPDAAARIT